MEIPEEQYLMHYGTPRRSGRYPWGSGQDPFQNAKAFKTYFDEMSKTMSPKEIAEAISLYSGVPYTTTQLRSHIAISGEYTTAENISRAHHLRQDRGASASEIGRIMGVNESTVRGWLKVPEGIREGSIRATAQQLREELKTKPFLDVGKGNHLYMGISETKLRNALALLQDEGHGLYPMRFPQLGTDKMTPYLVLTNPGVDWHATRAAVSKGELRLLTSQSDDGGTTFKRPTKDLPVMVDSKRIAIRYKEDGGGKMDGVVELRRGVEDISLNGKRYAQVRIAVDGTHYIKGMAMYADDLPAGIDLRFNTPKSKDTPGGKTGVMKPLKTDADGNVDAASPFAAKTRARIITGKNGKETTSALNIVYEEGKWDDWSRSLSSQMLSKQPVALASAQLGKARAAKQKDLDEILALTNPVVKKKLLDKFADSADAAAVHLKAAQMPRQATHVLLPMNSMRPGEIYAPNFNQGERVVLVRHPHGGPFEIPELVVNNRNLTARRIMENAIDAVGIHHSVANQLSGADFDGDTVLVIPNDSRKVKSRLPLAELKDFDPIERYKIPDNDTTTTRMTKENTQNEMGKISNLITDMTIKNANSSEIARAVRHSMVVIDAEKKGLDYKRSAKIENIAQLKTMYQGSSRSGASTIISRASAKTTVPHQRPRRAKEGGPIDPDTGQLMFTPSGEKRTLVSTKTNKKTGEVVTTVSEVPKETRGPAMRFTQDARSLTSGGIKQGGTPMENIYAAHANEMKAMANRARKESLIAHRNYPRMSPAAKAVYADEVASLDRKLRVAQRNAPLERRAQTLGGAMARDRIDANPNMDKDDIKKVHYQSLEEARHLTGATKKKIGGEESPLTDREWRAIQAGAISSHKLDEILNNADMDRVRHLATPRARTSLTPGQLARARSMEASGKTPSQIAESLGLPRSTVVDNLKHA